MVARSSAAVLFLTLALVAAAAEGTASTRGGRYSRSATPIWGGRVGEIPSPDGKKAILIRPPRNPDGDETHDVIVKVNGREHRTSIGAWVNAEAAWSPDSRAFFVTYSDGGNVGTYHVKIVHVAASGLHVTEPLPDGRTLFAPTCFDPEQPNVAAIRWNGRDSSLLLIAVQVPPHSSCADMGTFRVFEIELPSGRVVEQQDQLAAKRSLGQELGDALLNEDDDCVRNPGTCIPDGMRAPQ